jgi:hypothetical protein
MSLKDSKEMVRDKVKEAAKQMKGSISGFPDSPAKNKMNKIIEQAETNILKTLDDFSQP